MAVDPTRERSPIPGISRNVFLLGLVSLFTDASTEMIYPLIPLFLVQVLGAPVSVLGFIEGLAEATASVLKGFSGWFSDRLGVRRPLVIFGYSLASITKPLLALAGGWGLVLAARVIDRFGKGVRGTPRDAIIADSSDERTRGRAFGFHRSTDQTGAIIGPLLALPMLTFFHNDYRLVFVAAFLPAVLGVFTLFLVRETGLRAAAAERPKFHLPRELRGFILIMLIFTIGNSSDVFLLLRARTLGFSAREVVLVFTVFNAVYVASAYPSGIVSDRIGRRRVIIGGLVVFSAVYFGFAFAGAAAWMWPLFAIYGLYHGLTDGTSRAYIASLVDASQRGTALGAYSMAIGLAAFPASAIAGVLWDRIGPEATFLMGAASAGVAAIALSWYGARVRERRP